MKKLFLARPTSEALRSAQMHSSPRRLAFVVALVGAAALSGCAKKKHAAIAHRPSVPAAAPQTQIPSTEFGLASWYGHPYHGRAAANGEIYDMEKLTAAHRTLPFNTWVRVTNLSNNKFVDLRIIDRGPFIEGRIIDVSHAAAKIIELIGPGVAQVRIDILAPPPALPVVAWYGVQVAAFQDRDRAERYRATLQAQYGTARLVYHDGTPGMWRVIVGAVNSTADASRLAGRLEAEVGSALVVRLDDRPSLAGTQNATSDRIPR